MARSISPRRAKLALGFSAKALPTKTRFALPRLPFAYQCLLAGLASAAIGFLTTGRLF